MANCQSVTDDTTAINWGSVALKMCQNAFAGRGSVPDPAGGLYQPFQLSFSPAHLAPLVPLSLSLAPSVTSPQLHHVLPLASAESTAPMQTNVYHSVLGSAVLGLAAGQDDAPPDPPSRLGRGYPLPMPHPPSKPSASRARRHQPAIYHFRSSSCTYAHIYSERLPTLVWQRIFSPLLYQ